MLLVLLLLGACFSVATLKEQFPAGEEAAAVVLADLADEPPGTVLIVGRDHPDDRRFADTLSARLQAAGWRVDAVVLGQPSDARRALETVTAAEGLTHLLTTRECSVWPVFENLDRRGAALAEVQMVVPRSYLWPDFLKAANLVNITNQIAVIALVAVGMTMVILTGGIDLSVGSLVALSAVTTALLIVRHGAADASTAALIACSVGGVLVCAGIGGVSGALVTWFSIPPFIVTLAVMRVARGLAYQLSAGQSIYHIPEAFTWLGRGSGLLGIPHAVLLTGLLYAAGHLLMAHTVLGRYIYAVGGNPEAARLSGVPVRRVLIFVYAASGAMAGLGGVVLASQLQSGAPNYGMMYELDVIAAVVLGGTSLAGGEGKMLGTLIGALLIAVIKNGMNLTHIDPYTQEVVLGAIILGAVLLDRVKKGNWSALARQFARRR